MKYALTAFLLLGIGLSQQLSAQMNGNYTIDQNAAASATSFKSFTSAVQALRGLTRSDGGPNFTGGITGPVTFTVTTSSGPYAEQITLPAITGSSATNRITFDGNGQTLQFSATTNSAQWVFRFNGADYVTMKNLTVKTLGTTYGWGIMFDNRSDYNIVEDCRIDISSVTSTTAQNSVGITFTGSTTAHYGSNAYNNGGTKGLENIIRRNEIFGSSSNNGMYMGISMAGDAGNTTLAHNTLIEDNIIRNFYVYGIYSYYYFNNTTYRRNEIRRGTKSTITTFYGIYSYYSYNTNYYENKISQVTPSGYIYYGYVYGIYNLNPTYVTSSNNYYNNIVDLSGAAYGYGIMAYYGSAHNIYHNTVYCRTQDIYYIYAIYAYDYTYNATYNIKNNIVDMDGTNMPYETFCMYVYTGPGMLNSDYNVFPRRSNANGHYTALDAYSYTYYQTLNDWRNFSANPDANSTDVRPSYIGASTLNFEPTTIDLDGMGTPTPVTKDINGVSRSATTPDPGAFEFDIPINVSAISYPANICQGEIVDVEVTITNNSALNLSDFKVQYEIDGVLKATEIYTGTINAGGSGNFTFAAKVNNTTTGNYVLKANVIGKTPVTQANYAVNPSPVGSVITKGSLFTGAFNSGTVQDPDIVAYGDNINYKLSPPTGYNNSQYNTTWKFDTWELITPNGTSAGSQHVTTDPGAADGNSSFTPVIGQSDSSYILRYTVKSLTNGCVAPMVERRMFVAPRPVAAFTSSPACVGNKVKFDNNTTISSGFVNYKWRFGNGDSSVLINPEEAYALHGTYNVQLVAISNYGYESVANGTATVIENPVAEFGFTNTCEGAAIPFVDGSIIPGGTPVYTWNFGDGTANSNANNPSHQYASSGVYEVTMTVSANGCSAMKKAFVTQAPRANVAFSFLSNDCSNSEVAFTNNSTFANGQIGYSWDFGDNSNATNYHAQHTYTASGNYTVVLTGTTDFGCVNTATKQVVLKEAPVISFSTSSLCNRDNVTFTNSSSEPSGFTTGYEWKFSDANKYASKDVTRSFPVIGKYTVTLTAQSTNGCSDMEEREISIDEIPVAQFYAEAACEGSETMFQNATTGNNGNVNYSWDWDGDGNPDNTTQNPSNQFAAGTHSVKLIATTPSGCKDEITKTVTVHKMPTGSISIASSQVGDGYFTFTATGVANGTSYTWLFGDGGRESGVSTGSDIVSVYRYAADGLYEAKLRLSNANCDLNLSGNASVARTGVANINSNSISVYPNPSAGKFNIDLSDLTVSGNLKVMAADGRVIRTIDLESAISNLSLDLSGEAAGVYHLMLETSEGIASAKIILTK